MPVRRGMLIKNVTEAPLAIGLATRTLELAPGDEQFVSRVEVKDPVMREHLQIRTVAIVRSGSDDEEAAFDAAQGGA